jgi:aryl-alcohol dehydrogenase-like predicted oxidoreductase/predicted kinase
MGCMRLSTAPDRDDERSIAVLHAALDAGVTFLDTADAYAWNHEEIGHNERLIARAIASWGGDRSCLLIATKGGLTRPQGNWIPDGRARHLAAACEASCRALGVSKLQLYQLHTIDSRVSLATSVRALASLQRSGLVDAIGLCNVNVSQIEEARRIAEIASVQVELSLWRDDNLLNGVVEHCITHGIQVIAYRPLGGPQRRRKPLSDPIVVELAATHRATPFEVAIAWVSNLSDSIVAIPGASRIETAQSLARAQRIRFTDGEKARLDEHFPTGRLRHSVAGGSTGAPAARTDGEIVLIMGLPAAGKSTVARSFVDLGYTRLNRDEGGGSLKELLPVLDRAIANGTSRIVLDNTYVSRKSRAAVLQAASKHGLPVRCLWLSTSVEDAQVNAATRMLAKYGTLLGADEIRRAVKQDVSAFGPTVQFRYQRDLEPPIDAEGFSAIETMQFERRRDPSSFANRALIVWCDGVLRAGRSGDAALDIFAARGEVLRRYQAEGWQLCALGWQPEIADGTMTSEHADANFTRMQQALGVTMDVVYCPHGAGAPECWCRKPLPGLGVVLIERHHLDPSRCLYVGSGPQDPGFARRLGFGYANASDLFTPVETP